MKLQEDLGFALTADGKVKWSSYGSFIEEVGCWRAWRRLNRPDVRYVSNVQYLKAQQELIDFDIECALVTDKQQELIIDASLQSSSLQSGSNAVRVRGVLVGDKLIGVIESWDHERLFPRIETFSDLSLVELAKLMHNELHEPSLNFCTIYGDAF